MRNPILMIRYRVAVKIIENRYQRVFSNGCGDYNVAYQYYNMIIVDSEFLNEWKGRRKIIIVNRTIQRLLIRAWCGMFVHRTAWWNNFSTELKIDLDTWPAWQWNMFKYFNIATRSLYYNINTVQYFIQRIWLIDSLVHSLIWSFGNCITCSFAY